MAGKFQFGQQKELDELTDKILNREKFSYDLNGDAFYNQYKDKFTQQGKMAMMDTMGQAAALTGGYGSSYAQQVGQQTYQGYLQNLNDVVPELYQLARDNYDREGDALAQQFSLLANQEEKEYERHRDQVADEQYWAKVSDQREQDAKQQELNAATLMAQGGDYSRLAKFYGLSEEEVRALQEANQTEDIGYYDDNKPVEPLPTEDQPAGSGFTGTTYDEAVAHMKSKGVSDGRASGCMTRNEWARRKSSYQISGQGSAEVKNYNTYAEYLAAYVEYAIDNPYVSENAHGGRGGKF